MSNSKDSSSSENKNDESNQNKEIKKQSFSDQLKDDSEDLDKTKNEDNKVEDGDKKKGFSDQLKEDSEASEKAEDEKNEVDTSDKKEKKEDSDKKSKLKVSPKAFQSEKTNDEIESEKIKKRVNYSFMAFFKNFYELLKDILDIRSGSNVENTNKAILDDIEFRGANVWALIASIIIASIGLNINSTAVVIGAMLISPLMGPIIGVGWSIAVNDIEALNKSIKNFFVMVFLGIFTSWVYFLFSPLSSPSAEMIGRTSPTILDLFVAFFGGVAGIVSMSKSGKVNVILGVAIATALIPPLCTAGYGLAEGNMEFFIGASYLFLINSVFIGLASFIMIRYLRFPLKKYLDPKKDKRVKRMLIGFGILVMIPSAFTFYISIMNFRFESEAERFVTREINLDSSKILKMESTKGDSINTIELYMIGEGIDSITLEDWKMKMEDYQLDNTVLHVYQDRDMSSGELTGDLESLVRSNVVEDLYRKNTEVLESKEKKIRFLERTVAKYRSQSFQVLDIGPEARTIIPEVDRVAVGESYSVDKSGNIDTLYSMLVTWRADKKFKKKEKDAARERLKLWLEVRLKKDSVIVLDVN
jgi:uncharacterized hydrophobic protein (TIGR00271 family)